MERFLYRLSRSEHAEQFVLKGALMLQSWGGPLTRATRDIDLLRRTTAEAGELVETIRSYITVRVDDDGLLFDAAFRHARATNSGRSSLGRWVGNTGLRSSPIEMTAFGSSRCADHAPRRWKSMKAKRLGVPRQSIIKVWVAERLEKKKA